MILLRKNISFDVKSYNYRYFSTNITNINKTFWIKNMEIYISKKDMNESILNYLKKLEKLGTIIEYSNKFAEKCREEYMEVWKNKYGIPYNMRESI